MKFMVTALIGMLAGCCSDKAEYHRGWREGFDEAARCIEMSERVVELREELQDN